MQLGEYGLPLYLGASGALAAPSGAFVLRSSFQMIQLKSVLNFEHIFYSSGIVPVSDPEIGPMLSLLSLTKSDPSRCPQPVGVSATSWTMSDATSGLVRLGRLVEMQGIASSSY